MSELVRESRPTVSVVVIVLNGAPWIGQQLDSLAAQRDAPVAWEVVVADNGSTDGTQGIVAARGLSFPVPLRLVDASGTPGASHARNVGASAARADLLAFCDCDDAVGESWVREATIALAEHVCVGGRIRAMTSPQDPGSAVLNPNGLHGRGIQSCNFGVRREVFFSVGGFDESLPPYGCEDSEFSLRILAHGHEITPAPGMELYFRQTVGFRRTLAKVHASGVAETLIWHRHPKNFGRPITWGAVVGDLVRWPLATIREVASGGMTVKEVARSAITTWAHVVGYVTWVRTGRAGRPRLVLEPYDVV